MQCKSNAMKVYFQWLRRSLHSRNAVQNYCFFLICNLFSGIFYRIAIFNRHTTGIVSRSEDLFLLTI